MLFFNRHMTTPSSSSPHFESTHSLSTSKKTWKATRLRSLATRPVGMDRLVVHVDPATGKADGPHRRKVRTYLGIVAWDKVNVTFVNRKEVLIA